MGDGCSFLFASCSRSLMPFFRKGLESKSQQNQCYKKLKTPAGHSWSGEVPALVISLRSDCQPRIIFHQSPIRRASLACIELVEMLRAGLSSFTFHLSPIPSLSIATWSKLGSRVLRSISNVAASKGPGVSRAALLWPVEARDLLSAGRSVIELDGIGPNLACIILSCRHPMGDHGKRCERSGNSSASLCLSS